MTLGFLQRVYRRVAMQETERNRLPLFHLLH